MLPTHTACSRFDKATTTLTRVALSLVLAVTGSGVAMATTAVAAADPGTEAAPARPIVTASDGAQWAIDADDVGRGAGMLVRYTPDFGFSTFTNVWGAEAVVVETATPNTYRVTEVGSARRDTATAGNHRIPADGFVLSAGPSDTPGPVDFLTDHVAAGDLLTVTRPTSTDASREISVIDPTPQTNPAGAEFPGYRGADQLVQYTPGFGKQTGTNAYGDELTVENGIVTALGSQNSAIPENGYVLSGNGTAADFITSNSILGARVDITGSTVRIRSDAGIALAEISANVETARTTVAARYDQYIDGDFTSANAGLALADDALARAREAQGTDDQVALYYGEKAAKAARSALTSSLPSRVAQARGVWHRATETSPQQIQDTIAEMRKTGVNELYLEVFYGGLTIHPSEVAKAAGLPAQRPEFAGFDALAAWKAAADKAGISLHGWIDGLAVGNDAEGGPGALGTAHPEWLARPQARAGSSEAVPSANGFYWLDVADNEARTYLLDVLAEMVGRYQLAGINLDYMRYPAAGTWTETFGYSDESRSSFETKYGADPATLTPSSELWTTWTAFLDHLENDMVGDIYARMKSVDPGIVVSDAPEMGSEADKIDQWGDVLDVVIPQAYYTTSLDAIRADVERVTQVMTGHQLVYTGLSSMISRFGADATVDQTQAASDLDSGTVIFSWGQAGKAHVTALSAGPWRGAAISPGTHPIAATRAVLSDAQAKLQTTYVDREGISRALATSLRAQIQSAGEYLHGDDVSGSQLRAAIGVIGTISKEVSRLADQGQIDPGVATRLSESLGNAEAFLHYAQARDMR